jgi:hypothetical protein
MKNDFDDVQENNGQAAPVAGAPVAGRSVLDKLTDIPGIKLATNAVKSAVRSLSPNADAVADASVAHSDSTSGKINWNDVAEVKVLRFDDGSPYLPPEKLAYFLSPFESDDDPRHTDPEFLAWLYAPANPAVKSALDSAADESVNPRLTKAMISAVKAVACVSDLTLGYIGVWAGITPNLPPELNEQIDELQVGYQSAMADAMAHIPRRAADAHRAYLSQCEQTAIEAGTTAQATGKSLQDFEAEFKHRFDVAIKASKTYAPKARELVRPYIRDYVARIRALADKEANEDRATYNFFCLPWTPAPWIAVLYRAAEIIEQDLNSNSGHDPKSAARFLTFPFKVVAHRKFDEPEAPEQPEPVKAGKSRK